MELWSLGSSSVEDNLGQTQVCSENKRGWKLNRPRKEQVGRRVERPTGPRTAQIWETTEVEGGLDQTWHTTLGSCFWPAFLTPPGPELCCYSMCVYDVYVHIYTYMPWHMYEGQRTTWWNCFCPAIGFGDQIQIATLVRLVSLST